MSWCDATRGLVLRRSRESMPQGHVWYSTVAGTAVALSASHVVCTPDLVAMPSRRSWLTVHTALQYDVSVDLHPANLGRHCRPPPGHLRCFMTPHRRFNIPLASTYPSNGSS
ncbi:hypothetical protein T440DRAFT_253832 [Plenodomus tracheiphilus IPT5]|uniref:Uncharacterized protein n=1 Tax=Plenodomus tracheiphilus IPT5 TaxID=1408161 RepID=A0A6A7AV17_9PLEO|nr:hypothetical protein T440DRAFT_253832 [Plenodomus tracheiphilus IPT5]